jgi:hypothetical protein
MKPILCKAGQQLREQFDDTFMIVIGVAMDGCPINVIKRLYLTIMLIQRLGWYAPSMSIEMSISQASPTSCPILQIRFAEPQSVARSESPTSSSTDELHRLAWAGAGASIAEAIRIVHIAIVLSLRQAIRTALSLISRY